MDHDLQLHGALRAGRCGGGRWKPRKAVPGGVSTVGPQEQRLESALTSAVGGQLS